jgi:hypothetical protein
MSFEYQRSRDPEQRGLRLRSKKCLHLYKYFVHPRFGFMSVRVQTWFPFNIQICHNGREWLARQLRRRRSAFKRADNCFTWLGNVELAPRLMDEQLQTDWPAALDAIAQDPFLGGKVHGNFTGEIITSFKNRPEGVRVKHWVRGNSIKVYDKAGSVLRVETTIARTTDFKVLRPAHDQPDGKLQWRPLLVIQDQSVYIKNALHEINVHLVLGSILASLVVLAFMRNTRSTLSAAVAIPASLVATSGMMRLRLHSRWW